MLPNCLSHPSLSHRCSVIFPYPTNQCSYHGPPSLLPCHSCPFSASPRCLWNPATSLLCLKFFNAATTHSVDLEQTLQGHSGHPESAPASDPKVHGSQSERWQAEEDKNAKLRKPWPISEPYLGARMYSYVYWFQCRQGAFTESTDGKAQSILVTHNSLSMNSSTFFVTPKSILRLSTVTHRHVCKPANLSHPMHRFPREAELSDDLFSSHAISMCPFPGLSSAVLFTFLCFLL